MYAVLDIETTGGKYDEEGITEIAIYKHDGKKVIDQFSSLVNPQIPIQPFVQKLIAVFLNEIFYLPCTAERHKICMIVGQIPTEHLTTISV